MPALLWPVALHHGAFAWLSLSFVAAPFVDSSASESSETDGGFKDPEKGFLGLPGGLLRA